MRHAPNDGRPLGVTALGAFFAFGTLMSLTAGLARASPLVAYLASRKVRAYCA